MTFQDYIRDYVRSEALRMGATAAAANYAAEQVLRVDPKKRSEWTIVSQEFRDFLSEKIREHEASSPQ